jgi:hypothetical protein
MSADMLSRFHAPTWSSCKLTLIILVVLVVHILAAALRAGTIGFVFLCCFFVAHSFHNHSLLSFGGAGEGATQAINLPYFVPSRRQLIQSFQQVSSVVGHLVEPAKESAQCYPNQ